MKSAKHVQILQKLTQIQMLKLRKCKKKDIYLKNKLLKQFKKKKNMTIQKRNIRKRKKVHKRNLNRQKKNKTFERQNFREM